MPDPYVPSGASRSYDVPADADAIGTAQLFKNLVDTVETNLAAVQADAGLDPFFLMGA